MKPATRWVVEKYITAFYRLIETCDYANLANEMLQDHLIISICDTSLSEHWQMDPDLMLDKTIKTVQQRKMVKEQYQQLQEGSKMSHIVIEEVSGKGGGGAHYKWRDCQRPPAEARERCQMDRPKTSKRWEDCISLQMLWKGTHSRGKVLCKKCLLLQVQLQGSL